MPLLAEIGRAHEPPGARRALHAINFSLLPMSDVDMSFLQQIPGRWPGAIVLARLWRLQDHRDRRASCLVGAILQRDGRDHSRHAGNWRRAGRGARREEDFRRFRRTACAKSTRLISHEKTRRNAHRRHVRAHRGATTAHGMRRLLAGHDRPRATPFGRSSPVSPSKIFPPTGAVPNATRHGKNS